MRSLARFFTRQTATTEVPMPETTSVAETPANNVLMRFLTVGGATVEVTKDLSWECLGCDANRSHSSITYAREGANAHAEKCRAMPRPATT